MPRSRCRARNAPSSSSRPTSFAPASTRLPDTALCHGCRRSRRGIRSGCASGCCGGTSRTVATSTATTSSPSAIAGSSPTRPTRAAPSCGRSASTFRARPASRWASSGTTTGACRRASGRPRRRSTSSACCRMFFWLGARRSPFPLLGVDCPAHRSTCSTSAAPSSSCRSSPTSHASGRSLRRGAACRRPPEAALGRRPPQSGAAPSSPSTRPRRGWRPSSS
mmetsp:Transcript_12494/g.40729  ORF Transcript_12494/g.40729 Transcript_12494/m.40729 type:complete len:222 (-) Transcript_12494:364-1029(-)